MPAKSPAAAKPTPEREPPPVSEPSTAVVEASGLTALVSRAELDQQIATARAYPRSLKKFIDECMSMATLNEKVAAECIYALPRKEGGVVKMIEGPSARLAEIVASAWGNCRAGARIVEESREFVTAQGVFTDLERNNTITFEVKRRITNRYGQRYSTDMIGMTGNAACSIALRNVVFRGIPKAFWAEVYEAARKVVAGDAHTLANRRSDALAYLQKQGATPEMVFTVLGVRGIEDIGIEELATLRGLANAIKDGELTIEEAFNPKTPPPTGVAGAKDMLQRAETADSDKSDTKEPESDTAAS